MKRLEKQLSSKANSCPFLQLNRSNSVKGLRVMKIVKEIKFEGFWDELESKKDFQRQLVTKYLRLHLVFTSYSTLREKFNCYFRTFFASINTIFIFTGILSTNLSLYEVYTLS